MNWAPACAGARWFYVRAQAGLSLRHDGDHGSSDHWDHCGLGLARRPIAAIVISAHVTRMDKTRTQRLRQWAGNIKRDVLALWLAVRDPRVPCHAKALAALVTAYALSPIDLIPDFIPVLGYLDDLIIVPLGIMAVVRLIPYQVMRPFMNSGNQGPRYLTSNLTITCWDQTPSYN